MKSGWVYFMANRRMGAIYLGVTSNLLQRVGQHRTGAIAGFTKQYGCNRLVWYEAHDDIQAARAHEWQMKKWRREWKIRLIGANNIEWNDLWFQILQ